MVAVALVEAAALVAVVVAFAGVVARMQRAYARREDLLVNQLLHAAGRAWQPSPATETARAARNGDDEPRTIRFTASPEQLPYE